MNEINDLQNYILIKRDVRDLRQILFGENEIHDWDKVLILYSITLMYQYIFTLINIMNKVNKHKDFNFKRDFQDLFMFTLLLCNVRTTYLYMIKTTYNVDKNLAMRLHLNMGKYFDCS